MSSSNLRDWNIIVKRNIWALALLCAMYCVAAPAATDCTKQQLAGDESLSTYLKGYAADCLSQSLNTQLKLYDLPANIAAPSGAQLMRMHPAWQDIATTFGKLQSDIATGPSMKGIYGALQVRAVATAQELRTVLDGASIPDVSPLRGDGWRIGTNLILLEARTSVSSVLPDIDVELGLDADCPVAGGPLCAKTLEQGRELMRQWALADRLTRDVSSELISSIKDQVVLKDELWNTYLYDSKPMLPCDFVLTDFVTGGWSESDQFPNGFREPPETQWFLLHPSLGVEYNSDALDGEQLKPILFVEIVGANRWKDKRRWFDAPVLRSLSGASVIASYADRAGMRDAGYGILLTFSNVYSIGVADYGSETGLFLSFDFANLLREKYKPRYEKYKERLENFKSKLP